MRLALMVRWCNNVLDETSSGTAVHRIAEQLADLRAAGISDAQIARDVGADRSTIYRLRRERIKRTSHDLGTAIEAYWRINARRKTGNVAGLEP